MLRVSNAAENRDAQPHNKTGKTSENALIYPRETGQRKFWEIKEAAK